jgi:hypothetical protein
VLSLGYVSLHEQRKVTRSVGAKAFDVEVVVAVVAFNKQKIKRKSSGASSAPRGHRHLHERPWMISLRLLKNASRLRGDDSRKMAATKHPPAHPCAQATQNHPRSTTHPKTDN